MDEDDRYTRITLRIPKELHRQLSEAADQTSKSLNAEIVGRLRVSCDPTADRDDVSLANLLYRFRRAQAANAVVRLELLSLAYHARSLIEKLPKDLCARDVAWADALEKRTTILIDGLARDDEDLDAITRRLENDGRALLRLIEAENARVNSQTDTDFSVMVEGSASTVEILKNRDKDYSG